LPYRNSFFMLKNLVNSIKIFFTDPKWEKVRGVFWFCVITVAIHVSWRFWTIQLDAWPLYGFMSAASDLSVDLVYRQSTWFITHVLNITITQDNNAFYCQNGSGLILNQSCSGIKQIMQFAILMLFFPGPWKRKLWFIPLGMIIVHFTNVLRIILLTVVAEHWPDKIKYAHDNWLRIMFYVVIFALWLLWVEKIGVKKPEVK
jgi:exosortase/archaeosortase family protein